MKNLLFGSLLIVLMFFISGCDFGNRVSKEDFMADCTEFDKSPKFQKYCECAYPYYEKLGHSIEYLEALEEHCNSIIVGSN